MKFGQLIENNMNYFVEKSYTQNVLEKLFPDPYLKMKIEHIPGSIV